MLKRELFWSPGTLSTGCAGSHRLLISFVCVDADAICPNGLPVWINGSPYWLQSLSMQLLMIFIHLLPAF